MTKLPNRRLLLKKLKESKNSSKAFTVLYLDLDMFKNVNDSMGHQAGDELLKSVAKRLVAILNTRGMVARIGGDEFFVLLQDIPEIALAIKIAEEIIETFKDPFTVKGKEISITTSIGIAAYPDNGKSITELIRSADISLYRAKEIGKNRYVHAE